MIEKDLFIYLKEKVYPDLVMSNSPISRWDCYSPKTKHRIELKCRKTHYDELVIERGKFDAMIEKANDNFDLPIYINSTPQGIYKWNLFFVTPTWFEKQLPKTTDFSDNFKITKEIAMLPIVDAEIL
jgi:hypothetical protein|tara:strand:- start:5685 stop:6065 length:381 start_codon:yes stop_codon:yes gene_type:complete